LPVWQRLKAAIERQEIGVLMDPIRSYLKDIKKSSSYGGRRGGSCQKIKRGDKLARAK